MIAAFTHDSLFSLASLSKSEGSPPRQMAERVWLLSKRRSDLHLTYRVKLASNPVTE
jgi:hypothetical protein